MTLLPSECPNCGHLHKGYDFNEKPGPIQTENEQLHEALEKLLDQIPAQATIREEHERLLWAYRDGQWLDNF